MENGQEPADGFEDAPSGLDFLDPENFGTEMEVGFFQQFVVAETELEGLGFVVYVECLELKDVSALRFAETRVPAAGNLEEFALVPGQASDSHKPAKYVLVGHE